MNRLKERCLVLVASCFGLGYLPVAPGTFGALPGVGIFLAIVLWTPVVFHTWLILAALVVVCIATLVLSPWAERYWKKKDPGTFVTDEVAGFLATVLLFRRGDLLLMTIWAFGVTRIFDIIKIPPARRLERIHGGWGILLDDLSASLYAAGFLHLLGACLPQAVGL
jgi:phosphatidylglycerophosphatase A